MGLKSGSRDAGLDDESDGSEHDEPTDERRTGASGDTEARSESTSDADSETTDETEPTHGAVTEDEPSGTNDSTDDRPSVASLPYVLRRDRVNEGRDQVPFFLREEVVDGERDLRETLEATLGEDVYKSDLREAAMVVAQERPELVAEVLRRWGYDLS